MRARPDSGSTNLLKVTWTFRQNDPRMQAGCTPQANGRRGPSHLFADYRMSMNDWLIVLRGHVPDERQHLQLFVEGDGRFVFL